MIKLNLLRRSIVRSTSWRKHQTWVPLRGMKGRATGWTLPIKPLRIAQGLVILLSLSPWLDWIYQVVLIIVDHCGQLPLRGQEGGCTGQDVVWPLPDWETQETLVEQQWGVLSPPLLSPAGWRPPPHPTGLSRPAGGQGQDGAALDGSPRWYSSCKYCCYGLHVPIQQQQSPATLGPVCSTKSYFITTGTRGHSATSYILFDTNILL